MKIEDANRMNQMVGEILELVAYSSFEMEGSTPVERNCSVEEAMHELGEDIQKIAHKHGIKPVDRMGQFLGKECGCEHHSDSHHHQEDDLALVEIDKTHNNESGEELSDPRP